MKANLATLTAEDLCTHCERAKLLQPAQQGLVDAIVALLDRDALRRQGVRLFEGASVTDDGLRCGPNGNLLEPWTTGQPLEAWEALAAASVIPLEWVQAPARRFLERWPWFNETAKEHPPTVLGCLQVAADTHGILAAESLTREVQAGLLGWGRSWAPQTMVWTVGAWRTAGFGNREGLRFLTQQLPRLPSERELGDLLARAATVNPNAVRRAYAQDVAGAARWEHAVRSGATVQGGAHDGKPFASLPNPYAPLLALWGLGYALLGLDRHHRAMLYAPVPAGSSEP
jgi:hypothetical protein